MSKLFSLILGTLLFAACTAETPDSFVGKEYKLQNAPANAKITLGFDRKGKTVFSENRQLTIISVLTRWTAIK